MAHWRHLNLGWDLCPVNAIGVGIATARDPLPGPGRRSLRASASLSRMTWRRNEPWDMDGAHAVEETIVSPALD
jgi:hypothetical protein